MGDQSNNFGNVRPKSNKGFKEFATAKEGINAMADRMNRYADGITTEANPTGKPAKTLLEFTSIYAPKQDKNDPTHYAKVLGEKLGLDINQEINLKDPVLQKAMIPHIMYMENAPRATKALQRPEVQDALNSISDKTFETPTKQAHVNSTGSAPAIVVAPPAKPVLVANQKEIIPVEQAAVVQEEPVKQGAPVQKDAPVKNPMEEMQAAAPITPEELQYAQAAVPKQPSLYEMMDAYGAESPVATVTPMRSLQQMAQLQQSQNIRKAVAAANLGEGLAPVAVDTRVTGTNEQIQQIKADNSPMALFKQILANQQAEAMNYG